MVAQKVVTNRDFTGGMIRKMQDDLLRVLFFSRDIIIYRRDDNRQGLTNLASIRHKNAFLSPTSLTADGFDVLLNLAKDDNISRNVVSTQRALRMIQGRDDDGSYRRSENVW
jgi:hypothetical protein